MNTLPSELLSLILKPLSDCDQVMFYSTNKYWLDIGLKYFIINVPNVLNVVKNSRWTFKSLIVQNHDDTSLYKELTSITSIIDSRTLEEPLYQNEVHVISKINDISWNSLPMLNHLMVKWCADLKLMNKVIIPYINLNIPSNVKDVLFNINNDKCYNYGYNHGLFCLLINTEEAKLLNPNKRINIYISVNSLDTLVLVSGIFLTISIPVRKIVSNMSLSFKPTDIEYYCERLYLKFGILNEDLLIFNNLKLMIITVYFISCDCIKFPVLETLVIVMNKARRTKNIQRFRKMPNLKTVYICSENPIDQYEEEPVILVKDFQSYIKIINRYNKSVKHIAKDISHLNIKLIDLGYLNGNDNFIDFCNTNEHLFV